MLLSSHFTMQRKKVSSCHLFQSPPAIMDNRRSSFSSFSSSSSGYKAPLVRKLSGRQSKHRAPVITSVVGTSRNKQIQEEDEEHARAVSSRITRSRSTAGNFCRSLYARAASSQSTASLKNETWDEVATTSSVPNRAAASYKLAKHIQSVTGGISDDSGSDRRRQSLPIPSETTALNKPSLISDDTPRSKVAKHVHFTFKDNEEISYEVSNDDIPNRSSLKRHIQQSRRRDNLGFGTVWSNSLIEDVVARQSKIPLTTEQCCCDLA